MDQEMRALLKMTPKGEKFLHMLQLRDYGFVTMLLNEIMEAELELRMLAEGTKCLWYRPLWIQNGKNVADANLAIVLAAPTGRRY
jgi:hypothetical protein